jgi:hypothetical protein
VNEGLNTGGDKNTSSGQTASLEKMQSSESKTIQH